MRTNTVSALVIGLTFSALYGAVAQCLPKQDWQLPQGVAVKDTAARLYRFTVDYNTANAQGAIVRRQRLTADYQRGLAGGEVRWINVVSADADGLSAAYVAGPKRDFMEGFHYKNDLAATMQPDFFKGFPPAAVFERNLVWDTGMIEHFGQDFFEHLKLNEPYHTQSAQEDVNMPGVGVFHNRDVVLEWVGYSKRNSEDCAVITYQAFLNPLEIVNAGMSMKARSDYWGQIWVALRTKQIEFATINENVSGELTLTGQDKPTPVSVFRSGRLEPVALK
jgi:hypothetical protein